ncbi:MAG: glycosyltransferase family 2 protein [Thermodesulfobacteriota bacterium]
MKPLKVSLILLNWNRAGDTIECLRCLQDVTYENLTIILVDNGSTDGSVDKIAKLFPNLLIIKNGINLGFAGGHNVGIMHAIRNGADLICLLNNDTVTDSNFVREMVAIAGEDSSIGILGSKIYYCDRRELIWFGDPIFNPFTGRAKDRSFHRIEMNESIEPHDVPFVSGCSMMVRKEMIEQVGLLDEHFFCYGEEIDWCIRAKRAGFRIILVPKSRVYHKVSMTTGGRNQGITMYYRIRNYLFLIKKHYPLHPRLLNSLREILVIMWHIAALFRLKINKLEGIRFMLLGVKDYHRGVLGQMPESYLKRLLI